LVSQSKGTICVVVLGQNTKKGNGASKKIKTLTSDFIIGTVTIYN